MCSACAKQKKSKQAGGDARDVVYGTHDGGLDRKVWSGQLSYTFDPMVASCTVDEEICFKSSVGFVSKGTYNEIYCDAGRTVG